MPRIPCFPAQRSPSIARVCPPFCTTSAADFKFLWSRRKSWRVKKEAKTCSNLSHASAQIRFQTNLSWIVIFGHLRQATCGEFLRQLPVHLSHNVETCKLIYESKMSIEIKTTTNIVKERKGQVQRAPISQQEQSGKNPREQ